MTETRIVVGSGPSSVGVTHALLARGFDVVMLDAGERLDDQTAKTVARMSAQEPEQWLSADKAIIQHTEFDADPSLSPKRAFGSSYAYFNDPKIAAPPDMRLYGSRAFGGLSTVWGCALLRANPGDLADWPAGVSRGVTAAYPQIGDLIQQSTGQDIFADGTTLRISAQAQSMLERFRVSADAGDAADLYPTPLAISGACKACNGCMYGCVYDYTYSSRSTIEDRFMRHPRFRYVGGAIVERYRETGDVVEIHASHGDGRREILFAKQLFLAAGTTGSLRIIWNSSFDVSRTVHLRDCSYFLIPGFFLSMRGSKHHGLSHLSIDLKKPPFAAKAAHAQLYFNNPAVADGINARLGALAVAPVRAVVGVANHFLIAGQGYLHSDFCNRIRLACDDAGVIHASVHPNPENAAAIDAAISQFTEVMRRLGAIFVRSAAKIIASGGSKTAGALPHAGAPDPAATDLLGRPFGARNVFVVDGTVLPSVHARNHTLTIMANALRIGQAA
jgi:choline dehydrogenase-like flavoprotein